MSTIHGAMHARVNGLITDGQFECYKWKRAGYSNVVRARWSFYQIPLPIPCHPDFGTVKEAWNSAVQNQVKVLV
jgi:hypothetical protein